jgi:hypothetical protein
MRFHVSRTAAAAWLAVLFVALGGTSVAAVKLARNSVGTVQLRANAVRSSDLAPGAVQRRHVAADTLTGAQIIEGTLGRVPLADAANTAALAADAEHARVADRADTAGAADTAGTAGTARHAVQADRADRADLAGHAVDSEHAERAERATNAVHADTADRTDTATSADRATVASRAERAENADRLGGLTAGEFVTTKETRSFTVGLSSFDTSRTFATVGPLSLTARCSQSTTGSGARTDRAWIEGETTEAKSFLVGPVAQLGGGPGGAMLTPSTSTAQRTIGSLTRNLPAGHPSPRPPMMTATAGPTALVSFDGRQALILRSATFALDIGGEGTDTFWRACAFLVHVDVVGAE